MANGVSVVIPSYNHAAYIEQAILSVLNQEGVETEVVVVDDGSTDGSKELLNELSQKWPSERLQVIFQQNQGAHAAINNGLKVCRFEFLAILNSDDYFHPQRFQKLLSQMQAEKGDLIFSKVSHVDGQGREISSAHPSRSSYEQKLCLTETVGYRFSLLGYNLSVTTGNFLFKKSLWEKVGPFQSYRTVHDWDFVLKSLACGRVLYHQESLLYYRLHQTNTISQGYDDSNDTRELLERFFVMACGEGAFLECPSPKRWPVFFESFLRWQYPAVCDIYESIRDRKGLSTFDVNQEECYRALDAFRSLLLKLPNGQL